MAYIEDEQAKSLAPEGFNIIVKYTKGSDVQFSFNEGAIQCSAPSDRRPAECNISLKDVNTLKKDKWIYAFVFLDVGKWCHEPGKKEEYDFGLVSGKDVYLCEYLPENPVKIKTRNAAVQNLFDELNNAGDGVKIINMAKAFRTSKGTLKDTHLYLFLPDTHLSPISYYCNANNSDDFNWIVGLSPSEAQELPQWIESLKAFTDLPDKEKWEFRNSNSVVFKKRRLNVIKSNKADFFGSAGPALIRFLKAIQNMPSSLKQSIHFVSIGDTLDLWERPWMFHYMFDPNPDPGKKPNFVSGGEAGAKKLALEVLIFNPDVIREFKNLEGTGLAEVSYVWGNHDGYLMHGNITADLGLARRNPCYYGLNGDLLAEHGHRFHGWNYDNASKYKGPMITDLVYKFPGIRDKEGDYEKVSGAAWKTYLIGYGMCFLHNKFCDPGNKIKEYGNPFRILVIGHTHERKMKVCYLKITEK